MIDKRTVLVFAVWYDFVVTLTELCFATILTDGKIRSLGISGVARELHVDGIIDSDED